MRTSVYSKVLDQIEKQFRFHGVWQPPEEEYPQVSVSITSKPSVTELAHLLDRILYTRSIPVVTRIMGSANEEIPEEFLHDCESDEEREDLVRREMHRMIADLDGLPEFDVSVIDTDALEDE